ncbi:lytic transglycosylase domain-containing protein [Stakelama tenebrarum]|uniref:Lytic transglycosylase domain-containing protein n=1 Tax=Stakelama tenebrarum TaxID=2711215 RepID=A0A6G6Y538_9SPHN|nr:lytic transglycosylase domain-containing protein [Sphingosinithalassobacter tenebrarum]QIG80020.1 lytic transglycosylase domain-containing protein [Sphingosinithalassobacter tenebrarum]
MLASLLKNALLVASVSGVAATSQLTQEQVHWYRAQLESGVPGEAPAYIQSNSLADALVEWKRLQQSDDYPFAEYAGFLLLHPGWPGETSRRAAAETVLESGAANPGLTVRFFEHFAPLTAAGHLRFAEALAVSGEVERANEQARLAWRTGSLRETDESALLARFAPALRFEDHDARMDMLLWNGATSAAARLSNLVSPEKRALFAARLAFRTDAENVAELAGAVTAAQRRDPGFMADRAMWLRNNGQSAAMRSYLAEPHRLTALPGDVEEWYEVLLLAARGAANDGNWQQAYAIASQVDDAFVPGTDVSEKSYGVRDDYTSLVWLAGTTAFYQLNRPNDAMEMFARYGGGSRTPQTRSKGFYWAGRGAEAAGQPEIAKAWYERAAGYPDLYYGQLAKERMGLPLEAPAAMGVAEIPPEVRTEFYNREVVRAAQMLGTLDSWEDQSLFVRQIANDADSDAEHVLSAELARTIDRPDLGVMVGRSALRNGFSDYTAAGYPSVRVPVAQQDYWTIIHAISRQESQFDRAAISHAGARGLMQLMPATAREQAGKMGLSYSREALTRDPEYNIQLGSSYFQRMLSYYGGSYPLAVAAYNAGPGNVNRWIRANGDPRTPSVDIVKWVEEIPIFETKNYVQRVLENAVVYDLMNPEHARSQGDHRLSWYLGKRDPG